MNAPTDEIADDVAFTYVRTLDAPRDLVWKAHTERDRLMRWWGPAGFKMLICDIDLRPGGVFLYGMQAPDGSEMWGRWVFREIVAPQRLSYVLSFSDRDGGIATPPFAQGWPPEILTIVTFTEQDGKTVVRLTGAPLNATPQQRQTYADGHASMRGGFGGTFDQLEAYLAGREVR